MIPGSHKKRNSGCAWPMVAIPELPADARFVRALLQSEELLQQQVDFQGTPVISNSF
jgi:hypothetical protein